MSTRRPSLAELDAAAALSGYPQTITPEQMRELCADWRVPELASYGARIDRTRVVQHIIDALAQTQS